MGKNRLNKYNDEVKKDTKKDTEVPEGYRKIELKDAEMPEPYTDPKIKYNTPKPYIKNPEQYKSMENKRPKKYILVPKDSSKIKEFNHGGEAVTQGVGIALKGTGFKGVF